MELNNSYEDAQLADVIMSIGGNPYETQTNYFLNHWVPNLQGGTVDKKKALFSGESVAAGKITFVDPRRNMTVGVAETIAGKQNVLHLDLQPVLLARNGVGDADGSLLRRGIGRRSARVPDSR